MKLQHQILFTGHLILIAMLLNGCEKEEISGPPIRPVKTITVEAPKELFRAKFNSVTSAVESSNVGFRVSGLIQEISVDIGDQVQKGDTIAKIDDSDFELSVQQLKGQLEQATAQLEAMKKGEREEQVKIIESQRDATSSTLKVAKADFERYKKLYEDGVISKAELDTSENNYQAALSEFKSIEQQLKQAKEGAREEDLRAQESLIESLNAQLKASQNSLEYTILKAPFSGSVTARLVDAFEQIQAQSPVVTLQNTKLLEMTIGIPEDAYRYRNLLQQTTVTLTSLPEVEFPAVIHNIGIDRDPETNTYPVIVRFNNDEQLATSGMSGQVHFGIDLNLVSKEIFIIVPITAIFEDGNDRRSIWVVENNQVKRRDVEIGRIMNDGVQIRSGLKAEEIVVTAGVNYLYEGRKVRILNTDNQE